MKASQYAEIKAIELEALTMIASLHSQRSMCATGDFSKSMAERVQSLRKLAKQYKLEEEQEPHNA